VESSLQSINDCPLQGNEGAPAAIVHIYTEFRAALKGVNAGDHLILFTWLHLGNRDVLQCYPRRDIHAETIGVFANRSPDRPNPVGYHKITVTEIIGNYAIKVEPLETLDGTPVIDIKPDF
jgi:L-fuculose-phosphate aldolase